ncbi:MAG: hypothetical protein HYW51_00870 [Candidatus Doudnabacteria bacterium]|nr:hypothetical protein [Candidatus Doudnabacteria bacterium]
MTNYLRITILIVIAGLLLYFVPKTTKPIIEEVVDFETCADAGYPIAESFPRQCVTPAGRTFVEETGVEPEVIVDTPQIGELVTSPFTVAGRAKGYWFFEANLPVTLKDQTGNILVRQGFMTQDDWMTEDYVEFSDVLIFPTPTTEFGALIIEKDNPSGLPEFDASFAVPVRFK